MAERTSGGSGPTTYGASNLSSKRAYSAAEAGVNAFLYNMHQNPNYWQTCANDTVAVTPVPGATGSGSPSTGYAKNYNYDDRLASLLPPYLFDISNSGWHISRETICVPVGQGSNQTTICK